MNYLELISLILAAVGCVAGCVSLIAVWRLRRHRTDLFGGKTATSLEDFIINQNKKINELGKQADYTEDALQGLREIQKLSIQKMGLVRYNPFQNDGGNLSFSVAILDGHHNGVVITSMHSRDQNRMYAKPIKSGASEFGLTEEEKNAITESINF